MLSDFSKTLSRRERAESLLRSELAPTHVEVIDESMNHRHNHKHLNTAETHLKAIIVSPKFAGLTRVKRQQLVYQILQPLFTDGLHALSLTTLTPDEWNSGARANASPACAGAKK